MTVSTCFFRVMLGYSYEIRDFLSIIMKIFHVIDVGKLYSKKMNLSDLTQNWEAIDNHSSFAILTNWVTKINPLDPAVLEK